MKIKALRSLYLRGRITESGLRRAVADGVITAEDFTLLTGAAYTPPAGGTGA